MPESRTTHEVDPSRLADGLWDHEQDQRTGEGDIAASYSADLIAMEGRIRRPFNFHGKPYVCVGRTRSPNSGEERAEAYRLVHRDTFNGAATTYAEKTRDSEAARSDPEGFYHGMTVDRGGVAYILAGPPVRFIEGPAQQLGLFKL